MWRHPLHTGQRVMLQNANLSHWPPQPKKLLRIHMQTTVNGDSLQKLECRQVEDGFVQPSKEGCLGATVPRRKRCAPTAPTHARVAMAPETNAKAASLNGAV